MTELPHIPGLDRDGHLSELAIDHYLFGEPAAQRVLALHLAACAACRASVAAMQALDDALGLAPELPPRPAARPRWIPSRGTWLGLSVFAIAAVFTLAIGPWRSLPAGPPDEFAVRGSSLVFTVHLHDGVGSRAGEPGDVIHAGDRARFTVALAEDGYLLIAGIDDHGDAYAGYPQEEDAAAVYLAGSLTPLALPTAIEFDDSPGREHLFAMLCDHPFALPDMTLAMRASVAAGETVSPPPGCALRRVDLDKRAP